MPDETGPTSTTARTLTLMWRRSLGGSQRSRGPKQRVSVDDVVRAGIAVADADGLEPFSMRKVAERLGLGVMSLYTYVPGRSELLGLMVDEVTGQTGLSQLDGPPRARMTRIAQDLHDEYQRHPWLLQVDVSRPWIGPHGSARYEWQLAAIENIGLTDLEMDQVVTLLTGLAATAARTSTLARRAQAESGMTDTEWWQATAPILEQVMDDEDYPVSRRVGHAAGETYNAVSDPERSFRFGLDRLLDGIDVLLQQRAADTRTHSPERDHTQNGRAGQASVN